MCNQGEICRTDAVRVYATGYAPDCNGNNARSPYLVTQVPPSPRSSRLFSLPLSLKMDQDEAFVWVGRTPPETRYFSYQLYLMSRFYADEENPTIKKIYARLGDAINMVNVPFSDEPFEQFFVLIIAANQDTHDAAKQAVLTAGIDPGRILSLVIPSRTEPNLPVRFGLDLAADSFNFLHRASVFAKSADEDAYTAEPTLEILRVPPIKEKPSNPMKRQASRDRRTGVREQDTPGLAELLDELKNEIITAHGGKYRYIKELKTSTWMYPGGDVAIAEAENVLGETYALCL